jgi:hypothetical protein
MATCLREAAPAKAGNATGGFFQQTQLWVKKAAKYVSLDSAAAESIPGSTISLDRMRLVVEMASFVESQDL